MATKEEKKEQLRKQILEAAKIYSTELAGKVFLYVYGHEYFEVSFKTDRFLHLTGVVTNLKAQNFYDRSIARELTVNQFGFNASHPFAKAKKKLPCLIRLPELTKDYVCILKNQATMTITYKLSVTNLEFTLGLTENLDYQGNKINDLFLPRSLRVKDKAVEQSEDGEIVDFIFVRDASIDTYHDVLVADPNKDIPKEIAAFVDPKFFPENNSEDERPIL